MSASEEIEAPESGRRSALERDETPVRPFDEAYEPHTAAPRAFCTALPVQPQVNQGEENGPVEGRCVSMLLPTETGVGWKAATHRPLSAQRTAILAVKPGVGVG